ncbi:ATP-binding cassette domain-containing protein, partial [Microcoleus sp. C2C3]
RADGHTILYVSHRLHEVLDIADKITVLRDGQYVDTLINDNLTEDDLIRRMVGRDLALTEVTERSAPTETVVALAVDGLSLPGKFEDVSLDVRKGEIVGVFGLEGSGAEDFSRALYGLEVATGGRIELLGKPVLHPQPTEMMQRGMS